MSVPTTDPSTMPGDFQQQPESSSFGNIGGSNRPRPPPPNRPNPGIPSKKPDFKKLRQTVILVTNLVTLTGKDNYQVWANQIAMVCKATGLYEGVMEGVVPSDGASDEETDTYNEIASAAQVLLIQLIDRPILVECVHIHDPNILWRHLRTTYYSDTAFSFVHQLYVLFSIGTQYDPSRPLIEFIQKFESEWSSVSKLSSSGQAATSYRKKLNSFLECDEAKRDILLSTLIPHMSNIIDNITTKPDMTYAEAKMRLISLPSNQQSDSALLSFKSSDKGKHKKRKTESDKKKKDKKKKDAKPWCTYCKKHHPHDFEGHTWVNCQRLKDEQKKRKEKQDKQDKQESAHVSTENVSTPNPSTHKWKFDSYVSSHMTSNIEHFEHFTPNHGTIEVRGNYYLEYEGKGTCIIYPLLPDGTSTMSRCA